MAFFIYLFKGSNEAAGRQCPEGHEGAEVRELLRQEDRH